MKRGRRRKQLTQADMLKALNVALERRKMLRRGKIPLRINQQGKTQCHEAQKTS